MGRKEKIEKDIEQLYFFATYLEKMGKEINTICQKMEIEINRAERPVTVTTEYFVAARDIDWLDQYFRTDFPGFYAMLGKKLKTLCLQNETRWNTVQEDDNTWRNIYPVRIVELFKKQLDKDNCYLEAWRK